MRFFLSDLITGWQC